MEQKNQRMMIVGAIGVVGVLLLILIVVVLAQQAGNLRTQAVFPLVDSGVDAPVVSTNTVGGHTSGMTRYHDGRDSIHAPEGSRLHTTEASQIGHAPIDSAQHSIQYSAGHNPLLSRAGHGQRFSAEHTTAASQLHSVDTSRLGHLPRISRVHASIRSAAHTTDYSVTGGIGIVNTHSVPSSLGHTTLLSLQHASNLSLLGHVPTWSVGSPHSTESSSQHVTELSQGGHEPRESSGHDEENSNYLDYISRTGHDFVLSDHHGIEYSVAHNGESTMFGHVPSRSSLGQRGAR